MDALYKLYLVAIFGGVGLALIAGAIADAPLGPAQLQDVAERGPAALGVAVALAVLAGAATIVSTHRRDVIEAADRCIALRDGELAYDGPPEGEEVRDFFAAPGVR